METEITKSPQPDSEPLHTLEKLGTGVDWARNWISRSWKLGIIMAKGAYLSGERKRLFLRLGEAYHASRNNRTKEAQLADSVAQLERLTKKLELQEMLVRSFRFGKRGSFDAPPAAKEPTTHV